MIDRLLALSLAVLALTVFTGRCALADDQEATHEGTVVKAADGKLTMTIKGNKHTHEVAKDAKITLDDKPAKLDDLKEGYHITVTTHGKHGVVKITAHSKAK